MQFFEDYHSGGPKSFQIGFQPKEDLLTLVDGAALHRILSQI